MKEIAEPYSKALEQMDSNVGIDITATLLILAEIGSNVQQNFKTSAHLCSLAWLSPRNDQSAGKIKSKKVMHGNPYIKSILYQVAWVAAKNRKNPFGLWFQANQQRLSKKKTIVAVSRKILSNIYYLLVNDKYYDNDIAMRLYPYR